MFSPSPIIFSSGNIPSLIQQTFQSVQPCSKHLPSLAQTAKTRTHVVFLYQQYPFARSSIDHPPATAWRTISFCPFWSWTPSLLRVHGSKEIGNNRILPIISIHSWFYRSLIISQSSLFQAKRSPSFPLLLLWKIFPYFVAISKPFAAVKSFIWNKENRNIFPVPYTGKA